MKRTPILVLALVAASVLAGSSSAQRSDLPGARLSPQALAPNLGAALDSRLAQIALSVRTGGSGAALATARSQGLLVTQGKVRVVVYARSGHVAAARSAVRLVHGNVVVTSGKLIEALVPPKSLQKLAASKFVVRLQPVKSAAVLSTMTGLRTGGAASSIADLSGAASAAFASEFEASAPEPPTDRWAEGGDGQATVSFTPPAYDGGDQIALLHGDGVSRRSVGQQHGRSDHDPRPDERRRVHVHGDRDERRRDERRLGRKQRGHAARILAPRSRSDRRGPAAERADDPRHAGAEQPAPQRPRVLGRAQAARRPQLIRDALLDAAGRSVSAGCL